MYTNHGCRIAPFPWSDTTYSQLESVWDEYLYMFYRILNIGIRILKFMQNNVFAALQADHSPKTLRELKYKVKNVFLLLIIYSRHF